MLEIGSIVDATITQVSRAYVLAKCGGDEIFIDRTEFFWVWPSGSDDADLVRKAFPVNSTQRVYVMRYLYPVRQVLGSLRRPRDDENPYRELSRQPPGVSYDAIVNSVGNRWAIVRWSAYAIGGSGAHRRGDCTQERGAQASQGWRTGKGMFGPSRPIAAALGSPSHALKRSTFGRSLDC
jgi:hypothetical protein